MVSRCAPVRGDPNCVTKCTASASLASTLATTNHTVLTAANQTGCHKHAGAANAHATLLKRYTYFVLSGSLTFRKLTGQF